MKFERFSSRNIENTNDRRSFDDVSKDMKDSADEINRLLEKINLNDEESPTSSLENLPSFDKHRAQRIRAEATQENREARYGIDQEAARRKEKSEEIRARLLDLYNNNAAQNDAMLNQNPTQNKGWGDQEDSSSSKNDDEVQRKIEELKKNLGSAFRR